MSSYLDTMRRWKWLVVGCLAGAAAGYAVARELPARYTCTETLASVIREGGVVRPGRPYPALNIWQLISSRPEWAQLIALSGAQPAENEALGAQIGELSRNIAIAANGTAFSISCTAVDALKARAVCDEAVRLLMRPAIIDRSSNGAFLAEQFKNAKRDRDEADAKLAQFARAHAADLAGTNGADLQRKLAQYNSELQAADADLKSAQEKRAVLAAALFAERPAATRSGKPSESADTLALEEELATKQAQLVTLQTRYTPDHPDVVKLRGDIATLQKKIDEANRVAGGSAAPNAVQAKAAPDAAQLQAQVRDLDKEIQEKSRERDRLQRELQAVQGQMESGPMIDVEYRELKSRADSAQEKYDLLAARQDAFRKAEETLNEAEASRLELAGEPVVTRSVHDPAIFTLGGAGCGLVLGMAGALLLRSPDKRLRTEHDIERFLDLPTLAVIPETVGGNHSNMSGSYWQSMGKGGEKGESVLTDV